MNEKEAMEYIAYLNTLGSKPGLTVIRELLRRAGDPQKELAFIHIAGTNDLEDSIVQAADTVENML